MISDNCHKSLDLQVDTPQANFTKLWNGIGCCKISYFSYVILNTCIKMIHTRTADAKTKKAYFYRQMTDGLERGKITFIGIRFSASIIK